MKFSDACFELADRVGVPSADKWIRKGVVEAERERLEDERRSKINWVCSACSDPFYKGHRSWQNCMHHDGPCPDSGEALR